jgi:hypothetical protein
MPRKKAAAVEVVEPEVVSTELALPATGELIDLADAPAVARAYTELAYLETRIRESKRVLRDALIAESRRRGTKTLRLAGGLVARIKTKKDIVWDLEELEKLHELGLPEERYNELVQETVSYKVSAVVAKQIAGANEDYAKVIEQARTDTEGESVEVGRS